MRPEREYIGVSKNIVFLTAGGSIEVGTLAYVLA